MEKGQHGGGRVADAEEEAVQVLPPPVWSAAGRDVEEYHVGWEADCHGGPGEVVEIVACRHVGHAEDRGDKGEGEEADCR